MKKSKELIAIILCIFAVNISEGSRNSLCGGEDCNQFFENFMEEFNIYVPNNETKEKYKAQFLANVREINNFNEQPNNTFQKGINKFTCFPYEDLKMHTLGYVPPVDFIVSLDPTDKPDSKCSLTSFDWRDKGAVSPVKDQENCGSCFAFSAIAAIESQILIKYKKNVSLSEQYAINCLYSFWKTNDDSCNGGQPSYIYYMAVKNKGLPTSKSIPYRGRDTKDCPKNVSFVSMAAIKSFRTLSMYSEKQITCQLVNKGPISIAVYISNSFMQYKNGIFDDLDDCSADADPNHAILLVGFGVDPSTKMEYFIAKNSWGKDWGEKGFIRMKKGVNLCNLRILPQQPYY